MPAKRPEPGLIDLLPGVRGSMEADAPMARFSWFKTGGAADVLFQPADAADLAAFLKDKPADIPVTVIGTASNLIIRDGGVEGVVVRIGRGFNDISIDGDIITAGAAATDITVARQARDAGLAGLEFLSGIPGTIGGGLRMNAGAYGSEFKDIFVDAEALDGDGTLHRLAVAEMGFGYRHSNVPGDFIFTVARLRGVPGDTDAITRRMEGIQAEREATQPLRTPTGGSTFRNPEGMKAWELIERAGCRGLMRGKAQVSDLHCNFLINTGDATAQDLEGLGEEIRRRVFEDSGVTLEWEIRRLGRHASNGEGDMS
ncbi:MAG: UDP-N-acetylmuramate dehydrogenase [Rhodospirillales bacterium]|nr:UDP-N-acetylmuramate dehydrogenase [Alphaproteobacteria bacterium]MBL6947288.1 UDP-N-acetylmuramate dehydrogenase [Rhodospirillales bacterium]